jgi:hypothetical protein
LLLLDLLDEDDAEPRPNSELFLRELVLCAQFCHATGNCEPLTKAAPVLAVSTFLLKSPRLVRTESIALLTILR